VKVIIAQSCAEPVARRTISSTPVFVRHLPGYLFHPLEHRLFFGAARLHNWLFTSWGIAASRGRVRLMSVAYIKMYNNKMI
jgi:hypothetical protein